MKNNKLLYTSFILIVITLLVRWWVEEQFAIVERNEKFVAQSIKNQVSNQEFEMIPVLDSLSLFGHISKSDVSFTPYPFFIFKQGELKYWSDFKFVPSYNDIKETERYGFIDKTYGQFIVRRWVVNFQSETFEVFSLITLYRKYPINNVYIHSRVNSKIGKNGLLEIVDLESNIGGYTININGNAICKIKLKKGYKPAIINPIIYIDFLLLFLQILLFYGLYTLVINKNRLVEIALLLSGWTYFKIVLPLLEGTTSFIEFNLFDPQYYAVSWFERSFADLLINTLFILLISFRIGSWFKSKAFLKLLTSNNQLVKYGLLLIMMSLTFWIINYPFLQLRSLYDNSQVSIDISQSLAFGWTRLITFVIVILVSLSTFLFYHTVVRYLVRGLESSKQIIVLLAFALLIYLPLSYMSNMPFANLAIINIVLIGALWYYNFTRSLNTTSYKRFLYIVLFFGVLSAINAYFISGFETQSKIRSTKNIIEKKLSQSDPFAEFLLSSSLSDLSSDQFIIARMASPFLSKNTVVSKIKQIFLNSYLNKYDQSIDLFDAKGVPINKSKNHLTIFERLIGLYNSNNDTEYPNVFKINDELHDFSKHYLGYTSVKRENLVVGYVLIELIEKQFSSTSLYPSLLVDNRFKSPLPDKTSFAYYLNGTMVNSVGAIEFPVRFQTYNQTVWSENDYIYVSDSDGDRLIIASTSLNKKRILLSNFSFVWLITLFPILVIWFIIPFFKNGEFQSLSYTERIIWYLNLAFIIPLILVTAVTFRLLSTSFESESNHSKTTLVERIASQLGVSMSHYLQDSAKYDNLVERIEILSNNTKLDINLFNLKGQLIASSQPGVFNKKVLAPYINQYALNVIKEKGKNQMVLQESIDQLGYRNSYVAVKSEESGIMLGIISVPFFSSNSTLNDSKREAFNTILNVFVIVLFATMLVTYFVGKWLTRPLVIIRDKLRATSFSEQTEPINIQWSDELGMLIKAYNQMLASLEESKTSLKKSEKEKAWREAAQQVAHEIKNPLTPMKLTLQRMNNRIKLGKAKVEEFHVPLQSVLDQVETLNSIASSFSEFAKMPTPVVERSEINEIITKSAELFAAEKELDIKLQLTPQKVYSMIDPKLLSRMFNNLILNAKQSIKEVQEQVSIEITTEAEEFLTIKIIDNGTGINGDIVDKVFIPKFTTKEQGSGIGLAVTKYGIENMNGKIYFTTEVGVGTTFIIEFPIID